MHFRPYVTASFTPGYVLTRSMYRVRHLQASIDVPADIAERSTHTAGHEHPHHAQQPCYCQNLGSPIGICGNQKSPAPEYVKQNSRRRKSANINIATSARRSAQITWNYWQAPKLRIRQIP